MMIMTIMTIMTVMTIKHENIMTIKQINKTRQKIYRKIPTYLSGY